MKKFLSFAMIIASGVLFAQTPQASCTDCSFSQLAVAQRGSARAVNTSIATQNGWSNDANVYQTGVGNYSTVDQDGKIYGAGNGGDFNEADVFQRGRYNHSDIKQHGNSNKGLVEQRGRRNYAKQDVGVGYAENNVAEAFQTGRMNTSFQKQRYDNNTAKVTQMPAGGAYGRNYAEQDQSSGADAVAGSNAEIYQDGGWNEAKQVQRGSNNDAYSNQSGYDHDSSEMQTSVAGGSVTNTSTVMQSGGLFSFIGFGNKACVTQTATGGNNESTVTQTTSDLGGTLASSLWSPNEAYVTQTANASDNMSAITQTGSGNKACVEQTGN